MNWRGAGRNGYHDLIGELSWYFAPNVGLEYYVCANLLCMEIIVGCK
jgi:hypothetical protein